MKVRMQKVLEMMSLTIIDKSMKITGYWDGLPIVRPTTSFDNIEQTIAEIEKERLEKKEELVLEANRLTQHND